MHASLVYDPHRLPPRRSRPPLRRDFPRRRRIGRRAAAGLPAAAIARAERLAMGEVERLLAEPDFLALVAAYRSLAAMPEPARLERLVKLAFVLERALEDDDGRTALFVLMQLDRGRNPARTIAAGVSAACRRAAEAPAPPSSGTRIVHRPRLPADPLARAEGRVRAKLRAAVAAEHELRHAAEAERPPGPRRHHARPAASQRRRPAPPRTLPPPSDPRSGAFPAGLAPLEPGRADAPSGRLGRRPADPYISKI
jgi:hypothetical protein